MYDHMWAHAFLLLLGTVDICGLLDTFEHGEMVAEAQSCLRCCEFDMNNPMRIFMFQCLLRADLKSIF